MQIQRIEINKLTGDPANARKHGDRNIQTIVESLNRFGQQKPIVVDSSNCVRAGNGTLEAARSLGWTHLDCVVTDLKGSDAIAYAIADNRTAELAEWDDDILAATLEGLQLEGLLESAGFSDDELNELIGDALSSGDESGDDTYTNKVVAPVYEPKGEQPSVSELYDNKKTAGLMTEIRAAKLPKEIAEFLLLAAERHTVFNFRNIAEFYCHATSEVQNLMEKSGLVIIDFEKAIEYGFVHLTERLGELAGVEVDEDE
jgi:hypothetical protein